MGWFYRHLIRPALFTQEAEEAHKRALSALHWASRRPVAIDAAASFFGAGPLPSTCFGLNFPNPVGLAAGLDKFAEALPVWPALGFGFTELGGVTWQTQPGNPAPRLFRAVPDEAIVNRMGFNNPGAEAFAECCAKWRELNLWPKHPVGVNIGKSKITPLEDAAKDYASSLRVLWPHMDFFVVNVSSPNTPNLRKLQDKSALDEILAALQQAQKECQQLPGTATGASHPQPLERAAQRGATPLAAKPILVKVAPDLTFEALDEILELVEPRQIAGIVATNTTLSRPETTDPNLQRIYQEQGGLSGRPLKNRSTEVIRHLYRQSGGKLPIIGVGGVFNADDAWEKLLAGACLVQIYTGLIYEGPGLAKAIVAGLARRMEREGINNLAKLADFRHIY